MGRRKQIIIPFVLIVIILPIISFFLTKEENAYANTSENQLVEIVGADIVRYDNRALLYTYVKLNENPNLDYEKWEFHVRAYRYIGGQFSDDYFSGGYSDAYTSGFSEYGATASYMIYVPEEYINDKCKIEVGFIAGDDDVHDNYLPLLSYEIDLDKYPQDGVRREVFIEKSNYVETVKMDESILQQEENKKFDIKLNIDNTNYNGGVPPIVAVAGIEITTPSGKVYLYESEKIKGHMLCSAEVISPNIYTELGTYKYRAWLKKNNYIYFGEQYSFENITVDYVDNEVYVTDMFYGYPLALTTFGGLKSHNTKLNVTYAAVQSEYVQTPEFMVSSILSGLEVATNDTELIKYVLDNSVGTNFNESKYLDAANEEFINALCTSRDIVNIIKDTKADKMVGYVQKLMDFSADAQKLAIYEKYKDASPEDYPELYDEIIEYQFAKLKSEVTHVDGATMDLVKSGYYTYLKELTDTIDGVTEIWEIMDGLYTYITTYEYQMQVIDEILVYADPDSTLYKGMTRLKAQKIATFPTCYAAGKIDEEFFKTVAKGVKKAAENAVGKYNVTMYGVVQSVVNTTSTILLEGLGLESSDDYFTNLLVMQYANDMYDYMENKVDAYFGDVFVSDEIVAFEKFYRYYMAASDLAISKAKAYASYNTEYDEQFIEDNYSSLSYEEFLDNTKIYLNSSRNLDLMAKEFCMDSTYTVDGKTVTIRKPSDTIESSSIYTFKESIYGSLYICEGELIVPKDVTAIIKGDLKLNSSVMKVEGTLIVEGTVYLQDCTLNVSGSFTTYEQAQLYGSELYVDGEAIFKENVRIDKITKLGDNDTSELTINGKVIVEKDFNIYAAQVKLLNGSDVTVLGQLYMKTGSNSALGRQEFCDLYIYDAVLNANDINTELSYGTGTYTIYAELHMMSEQSKIIVNGDMILCGGSDFTKGKIILNGNEIQTLSKVSLYNAEILNPEGINLASNVSIRGDFNTYGCPIYQNGHTICIYENGNIYGGSNFDRIELINANINTNINCKDIYGYGTVHENGKLVIENSCIFNEILINYGEIVTFCDILMNGSDNVINNYGLIECGGGFSLANKTTLNNYSIINIKDDLKIQHGKQWSKTYFNNYASVSVGGSILTETWNYFKMLDEKALLCIAGDCNFNGSLEYGTVILNGAKKQIFAIGTVKNLIIDNPIGIQFSNNVNLYGNITTNNNPVYMDSYYLYFNEGSSSTEDYDFTNICFNGININKPVICDNLLITRNTNVIEGITVLVNNDILIDYSLVLNNYGDVTVLNDLILNYRNVRDDFYKKITSYNDYGKTVVKGDVDTCLYAQYSGMNDVAELYAYGLVGKVNSEKGYVYLVGDAKQSTYGKFSTLILQNKNGVDFTKTVEVNKLFNHNQNLFVLFTSSKFVDYDGDGILDNIDEFPTMPYVEKGIPYIVGDENCNGWDAINNRIDDAEDEIYIDMNAETIIPDYILEKAKTNSVDINLKYRDDVLWRIDAETIDEISSIDLGVNVGNTSIPQEVKDKITTNNSNMEFNINHNGEFGFDAILEIYVGKECIGQKAVLYYYNDSTGVLEPISECLVDEQGRVNFKFAHASDYLIQIININDVSVGVNSPIRVLGAITSVAILGVLMMTFIGRKRRKEATL